MIIDWKTREKEKTNTEQLDKMQTKNRTLAKLKQLMNRKHENKVIDK
jgi:hypothetical protein